MLPLNYILIDKVPVAVPDDLQSLLKWAAWMGKARVTGELVVKQECINDYYISTVFLGFDHSFLGPPQIFETMVFLDFKDDSGTPVFIIDNEPAQVRYNTWDQAERGHKKICEIIRRSMLKVVNANGGR